MRVSFFEVWNRSPHLETSLELARNHLEAGDEVHFHFLGHDVPYAEGLTYNSPLARWLSKPPERRGAELLQSPRFHFVPRVDLPQVAWDRPTRFASLEELKQVTFRGCDIGLGAVSSLVYRTRNSDPDLDDHGDLVDTMLESAARVYNYTRQKLDEEQPALVYTFNGRFVNYRPIMRAAQDAGVPLRLHERGADRFRYSVRPFMPHDTRKIQREMLAAWKEAADREEAIRIARQFFRDRRGGEEQAWKPFIRDQSEGALPELPRKKRLVTYFSSSDDEYVAVGDIYRWESWPNQYQAVLDLIDLCAEDPEIVLAIRLHPHLVKKAEADLERWLSLPRHGDVLVISPGSEIDTYALMEESEIVVTAGSTVGIEAVYWGKPSINLGPSLYSDLEATFRPQGREELRDLLRAGELCVDPERALPYGYFMATFGEEFEVYRPDSLFSGRFMGVDLQRPSPLLRLAIRGQRALRKLS